MVKNIGNILNIISNNIVTMWIMCFSSSSTSLKYLMYFCNFKFGTASSLRFVIKIKNQERWGELQDGGRVRGGDHLPPHKYIRNTTTCGTTPTEHLLNAGRRPQTSQKARNSPGTRVGQKKKETQRQNNRDKTCTSGRELWRRKGFHTLGSPFAGGDGQWQSGEAWEPRRREQPQGCGGQSAEIRAQRLGAHQHSPAREACLLTCRGGRGWELRLGLWLDRRERTGVGGVNTAWRG